MWRRDLFLVAGTAAVSSLLTYLAVADRTAVHDPARVATRAEPHRPPALDSRNDARAVDVVPASPGAASSGAQASSSAEPDPEASRGADDPAAAFHNQQTMREKFAALMASGSPANPGVLNARLESRFYEEEWDRSWAASRESGIRDLFAANESLRGEDPLVSCRSKNCQVVLPAATEEQGRTVSREFMQAAARADIGMKNKVVSFFPDVSRGRLVFYLSENGNTDLFR